MASFRKRRHSIALAIDGQSNERGNVLPAERNDWPQAFGSLRDPTRTVPIGPSSSLNGGWWHYVHDEMWDRGYDLQLVNGAIGSLSFISQSPSVTKIWVANTVYYGQRGSVAGDLGDFGDVIAVDGASRFFQCIGGSIRAAFGEGSTLDATGRAAAIDYITVSDTLTSGNTAPDWASASVGQTIADGGLVWLRLHPSLFDNRLGATLTHATQRDGGFDPLGVMKRLSAEIRRMRDVDRRIVYIANAQSDLGNNASGYRNALVVKGRYYLSHGMEVMLGLSCWGGNSGVSSIGNYETLSVGLADAISQLQAEYPERVHAGANLYELMGSTGPMAARTFRGSVQSGTMTVEPGPINWGGSLEVGMKVYDQSSAYFGQIASFGSGSGGPGTYNLVSPTNFALKDLRAVGSWLNGIDAVHLTGAGAVGPSIGGRSCAGRHVANALAAILPDRRPLEL